MDTTQLEKTVLSCFFKDPNLLKDIHLLEEEDFLVLEHKRTFANLKEFSKKGIVLDLVTYTTNFKQENIVYLTEVIAQINAKSVNFTDYCKQLKEFTNKRKLLQITDKINKNIDSADVFDLAEREILSIRETTQSKSMYTSKEVIDTVVQQTFDRANNPNALLGLDTGFKKLNEVLDGIQPGFHVIAARPGMGKTSLAVDLALNLAVKQHKKIGFFTLEMSKEQIYQKMLIQEAMIESSRVYKATMTDREWDKFHKSAAVLYDSKIFISDDISKLEEIVSQARRLKKTEGIDAIFIDYLQLIECNKGDNENERTGNISKEFMNLWKELGVPVIAVAQLSRGPEQRTDKRPRLSDLRSSGQIEQDALTVIMLYRDEYYNPDSKEAGKVEVLIEKNRFGPTGTIKLGFVAPMTKFLDLERVANR
ncbi:replicative DNA helicase [Acetoanaerobium noterae]|uniref:replicative DNA helicase n=1 Tax=Acetoanaerobium noterae TaxID=745369 RepID=UPI0032425F27